MYICNMTIVIQPESLGHMKSPTKHQENKSREEWDWEEIMKADMEAGTKI